MPYHHTNGPRIPRLLLVTVATVVSVGTGVFVGHTLGTISAANEYASTVQKINQNIENQLARTSAQSNAASQVAAARKQLDAAKTYQASLAAIDTLRSSLGAFNAIALKECSDTDQHIAAIDMTPVTRSNHIPSNIREGLTNFRETAAEDDTCHHAQSLIAYNNFSTFTLSAAATVKQINASHLEDTAAIKDLQNLLKKAPTATELQTLARTYGNDFTGYVKAHSELVKSYTNILTAKTPEELLLYTERIQANDSNLQALYDKSVKAYTSRTLNDSKTTLERTKRLYSEATIVNTMPEGPKINEAHLSGAILVNAIATYTLETGTYPTGQTLDELLATLKTKKYLTDTAQFRQLRYIRESTTGEYKLIVPGSSGDVTIRFTDKNSKPDKRTQTFKVQT